MRKPTSHAVSPPQAVSSSHGSLTDSPECSQTPFFGLHMVKKAVGVSSCAHLRHKSLGFFLSVSKFILKRDRNPWFSYNGFPKEEASIQHSTPNSSARTVPTVIRSEPMPWRRYEGSTAIQLRAAACQSKTWICAAAPTHMWSLHPFGAR